MRELEINTFTAHDFRTFCEDELGLRLVEKTSSRFMQLLAKVLFFVPEFMTYYTTIGRTIYWPNLKAFGTKYYVDVSILLHEGQHRDDEKTFGPLYSLGWLFPQVLLVPGLLLPLLAIWFSPMWLLALLLLLCAAPLPAPFRTAFELRGYSGGLLLEMWTNGRVPENHYEFVIHQFTDRFYYFMCPFRRYVSRKLRKSVREGSEGKMTKWQKKARAFLFSHAEQNPMEVGP